jgi:hypothetical protein
MARITISVVLVLVLAVLGACQFLAFGDFPAPSVRVEKVLPDARFPK